MPIPPIAMYFTGRDEWQATKPAVYIPRMNHPAKYLFCAMHTDSGTCSSREQCMAVVANLQKDHMVHLRLPDIKFNFLIGGDGKVYEGRGWTQEPSLPKRYAQLNNDSVYIAFIGAQTGKQQPPHVLQARDMIVRFGFAYRLIDLKFTEILTNNIDRTGIPQIQ